MQLNFRHVIFFSLLMSGLDEKDLESPSSMRLEALDPSRDSRARTFNKYLLGSNYVPSKRGPAHVLWPALQSRKQISGPALKRERSYSLR